MCSHVPAAIIVKNNFQCPSGISLKDLHVVYKKTLRGPNSQISKMAPLYTDEILNATIQQVSMLSLP